MQAALLLTGAMASMIGPIRNEQATHVLTDGIRNHQNSNLSKVCELKPNQAPVKFLSQRLQLRIYVYAGVELIGPRSCEAVDIYITDRSLSRQFHRLIFAREGKKEYEFTLEVTIDGIASYDLKEDKVRLDISMMEDLPKS